ncbi:MAG: hypothetical protein CR990_00670 [Desulfococcus sp.]|nr:MAG: hypothetical protein CR990_00670 [Desulfococcus sp.]
MISLVIFLDRHTTGDGLFTGLMFMSAMKEQGKSLTGKKIYPLLLPVTAFAGDEPSFFLQRFFIPVADQYPASVRRQGKAFFSLEIEPVGRQFSS